CLPGVARIRIGVLGKFRTESHTLPGRGRTRPHHVRDQRPQRPRGPGGPPDRAVATAGRRGETTAERTGRPGPDQLAREPRRQERADAPGAAPDEGGTGSESGPKPRYPRGIQPQHGAAAAESLIRPERRGYVGAARAR